MSVERALHFAVVELVGGEVIDAEEEQDEVGPIELGFDLGERLAGVEVAIVPRGDGAAAPEGGQVLQELVLERFVLMRVGDEDVDGLGPFCPHGWGMVA
jgi:hypothetical protein